MAAMVVNLDRALYNPKASGAWNSGSHSSIATNAVELTFTAFMNHSCASQRVSDGLMTFISGGHAGSLSKIRLF